MWKNLLVDEFLLLGQIRVLFDMILNQVGSNQFVQLFFTVDVFFFRLPNVLARPLPSHLISVDLSILPGFFFINPMLFPILKVRSWSRVSERASRMPQHLEDITIPEANSKFAPVQICFFLPEEISYNHWFWRGENISFREGNTFFACFITGSTFDPTRAAASDVIGWIESKRWPNQSNGEDVFDWKALFDTMTRPKEALFCTSPSNPHSWYDITWVSFTVLN